MIITPDYMLLEAEDFPPVDSSKGMAIGLRCVCRAELLPLGLDDDENEIVIPLDPSIISIDYIYEDKVK